jgi:hypothetical protein
LFDEYNKFRGVLHELEQAGYDPNELSVVARGEFYDQLSCDLRGIALVWLPNFGSIVLAGPLAWEIAKALRNTNGGNGTNPLETALSSVGLPSDRIFEYEEQVLSNRYLLIFQGNKEEAQRAHALMFGAASQTHLDMN